MKIIATFAATVLAAVMIAGCGRSGTASTPVGYTPSSGQTTTAPAVDHRATGAAAPAQPLPILAVARSYSGTRPAVIGFSGNGGNVVTSIR